MEAGHSTQLQRWLDQLHGSEAEFQVARGEIIRHTCGRLERLTRKMLSHYPRLKRWEQTGDVLQNALLRLHRSLEAVQPGSAGQFYGLAATQIRRELIDLARNRFGPEGLAAHHHSDGLGADSLPDRTDASAEPVTLAQWTEFHEKIALLPDAERDVFHLLWYEGLTQAEAGRVLGVTERTVKNRWRSAKIALKNLLEGDAPS